MNTYVKFVQDEDMSWWIGSEAWRHVCKSRIWFKTFYLLVDDKLKYMGYNFSIKTNWIHVYIEDYINLKGLFLSLSRNLVLDPIWITIGNKLVFERDKCIFSKGNRFSSPLVQKFVVVDLYLLILIFFIINHQDICFWNN